MWHFVSNEMWFEYISLRPAERNTSAWWIPHEKKNGKEWLPLSEWRQYSRLFFFKLKTGLYYLEMLLLQDIQLSVWAGSELMAEEQIKNQS